MTLTDLIQDLIEIRGKFATEPTVTDVSISYNIPSRKVKITEGEDSFALKDKLDDCETEMEKTQEDFDKIRHLLSTLKNVDDDYVQEIIGKIKNIVKNHT